MITYKELVKKHKILQVKRVNVLKTKKPFHPFEGFGIECSDGWYDLLDKLCTDIEKELKRTHNDKEEYPFQIMQIKEKFGGLRFYVDSATDKIYNMIDEAEKKSYTICEVCGKSGKEYHIKGWTMTLCKKCALKELYEWKDSIVKSIDKTKKEIMVLGSKLDKTKEENIEFHEACKWLHIGAAVLIKIDKQLDE